MGLLAVIPALPLYLEQRFDIRDPDELKTWSAVVFGAAPMAAAVCGPFWGALGDRVGRKAMVVRAQLGVAVALLLMPLAPDLPSLALLRTVQGMFAGYVAPAMALVSVGVPAEKQSRVLARLQLALAMGLALGPVAGAEMAEHYGRAAVFWMSSGLAFASVVPVALLAREDRSQLRRPGRSSQSYRAVFAQRPIVALLLLLMLLRFALHMLEPFTVLWVRELGPLDWFARTGDAEFAVDETAALAFTILAAGQLVATAFWGGRRTGSGPCARCAGSRLRLRSCLRRPARCRRSSSTSGSAVSPRCSWQDSRRWRMRRSACGSAPSTSRSRSRSCRAERRSGWHSGRCAAACSRAGSACAACSCWPRGSWSWRRPACGRCGPGRRAAMPVRAMPRRTAYDPVVCLLIGLVGVDPDYGVLVAGNRDEQRDRPAAPPGLFLGAQRSMLSPRDRRAHGTWMAVSDCGMFAGLTNLSGAPTRDDAVTRGNLPHLALEADNLDGAVAAVRGAVSRDVYNAFQLLVMAPGGARVLEYDGAECVEREVHPPVAVLSNEHRLGELELVQVEPALGPGLSVEARLDALATVLLDTGEVSGHRILKQGGAYGTVSSSLIALGNDGSLVWRYAAGPPDQTEYRNYGNLSRRLRRRG